MKISGIEIGGSAPCRTVAEISNNHNGDFARCIRLIEAAKDAGADFVKFQCYTPDELVALRGDGPAPEPWGGQGWTMRALYEKAQTPLAWFPKLAQHCRDIGMPWFSSVFGLESLQVLERCACPAYKIAALDSNDAGLTTLALSRNKPLLVSTRLAAAPYYGPSGHVRFLYCPAGYPTPPTDVQLPREFGPNHAYLGLSSHCLAPELPVAAVARGAKLLEYHMMLNEEPSDLEANVSLTEHQFASMVRSIRATEEMMG